ncbi:MAG: hypothetical protein DRG20_06675 [Deltaproteobacteria bacterium]|nr:MAG: hypothetical protein DRG20_06675 [Deltaproteobacteria bacterium]
MENINWEKIRDEAIEKLVGYIRINTSNPPGNEIEGARYLKSFFDKEDIEAKIFESAPKRGNLKAILKGDGSSPPIILLNHIDVVPVEREKWDVDPFEGKIIDGYIYGRGTIDMKSMAIAELMAMLILKRTNISLKRDIIFLATAGEETGGELGAKWMLDKDPSLLEAAMVFNEGGGIVVKENGEISHYEISLAQKEVFQFTLKAYGTSGHASMPHSDNPNVKLVKALNRLVSWETPFNIIPIVKEFFANIGKNMSDEEKPNYMDIEKGLKDVSFREKITKNLVYNAMLRNTISLTVLSAGTKVNVIPSEASAEIDCRLIPGTDRDRWIKTIKEIIDDESIEFKAGMQSTKGIISPADGEGYKAIYEIAQKMDPGAVVTPFLSVGATDSRYFREKGIPCYDFEPLKLTLKEALLIHGNNERVSVENLGFASRFMYEVVKKVATS